MADMFMTYSLKAVIKRSDYCMRDVSLVRALYQRINFETVSSDAFVNLPQ